MGWFARYLAWLDAPLRAEDGQCPARWDGFDTHVYWYR